MDNSGLHLVISPACLIKRSRQFKRQFKKLFLRLVQRKPSSSQGITWQIHHTALTGTAGTFHWQSTARTTARDIGCDGGPKWNELMVVPCASAGRVLLRLDDASGSSHIIYTDVGLQLNCSGQLKSQIVISSFFSQYQKYFNIHNPFMIFTSAVGIVLGWQSQNSVAKVPLCNKLSRVKMLLLPA